MACPSDLCGMTFKRLTMGRLGSFDVNNRLTALSAKDDPLEAIDRLMPWESFRGEH